MTVCDVVMTKLHLTHEARSGTIGNLRIRWLRRFTCSTVYVQTIIYIKKLQHIFFKHVYYRLHSDKSVFLVCFHTRIHTWVSVTEKHKVLSVRKAVSRIMAAQSESTENGSDSLLMWRKEPSAKITYYFSFLSLMKNQCLLFFLLSVFVFVWNW